MVSNNTGAGQAEEPLLGEVPTLGDSAWDSMLQTAFEAPPGFADDIVDSFEGPESAEDTIDADDYAPDFDTIAGGAGQPGDSNEHGDSLIDPDIIGGDDQDESQFESASDDPDGGDAGTESGSATEPNDSHDDDPAADVDDTADSTADSTGFDAHGIDLDDTLDLDDALGLANDDSSDAPGDYFG